MIQLSGQLAIRTISGRNGEFNVGRLSSNIGNFVVKDAALDQYKEGKYTGLFVVKLIKASSYTAGDRLVVENRAYLESMSLDDMDELSSTEAEKLEAKEPDPLDEEKKAAPAVLSTQDDDDAPFGMTDEELAALRKDAHAPCSTAADESLFGILWPLGESVKLDTTVDRKRLRDQVKRLEELGYSMNHLNQTWCKSVSV